MILKNMSLTVSNRRHNFSSSLENDSKGLFWHYFQTLWSMSLLQISSSIDTFWPRATSKPTIRNSNSLLRKCQFKQPNLTNLFCFDTLKFRHGEKYRPWEQRSMNHNTKRCSLIRGFHSAAATPWSARKSSTLDISCCSSCSIGQPPNDDLSSPGG